MWLLVNNIYMKKCEMVNQKKCRRIMQSGKTCAINCTILGSRLIWKEKIWLVLTKPYCSLANHNPEFRCEICTVLHFLHWYCITHFTLVLHILHSFLSQSELSNFFVHVIVSAKNTTETLAVQTTHHTISQRSILLLGLRDCVSKWNTKTQCGLFITVSTLKLWLSN